MSASTLAPATERAVRLAVAGLKIRAPAVQAPACNIPPRENGRRRKNYVAVATIAAFLDGQAGHFFSGLSGACVRAEAQRVFNSATVQSL